MIGTSGRLSRLRITPNTPNTQATAQSVIELRRL